MRSISYKNQIKNAAIWGVLLFLIACNKTTFLDAKPVQSQVVPSTLADFQALLDNDGVFNGYITGGVVPSLGEIGTTDFFVPTNYFSSLSQAQINEYTWAPNPYPALDIQDWDLPYEAIFYANEVLIGMGSLQVPTTQITEYNNIKGSALFLRAFYYYQLDQIFAPAYDSATSSADLGIPLRLTADVNEKLIRVSVQKNYDQIVSDLKEAIPLLPTVPALGTRPGRAAAYTLLAKVYLLTGDYNSAFNYADSSLGIDDSLIDYNALNSAASYPIARFNKENLFSCILVRNTTLLYGTVDGGVDTGLVNSYQTNDLRKQVLFKVMAPGYSFKGSYDGTLYPYGGIAVDETLLIHAECNARRGNISAAMADLNALLIKRWKSGTFSPFTATDQQDALRQILAERRKELVFRGVRWTDLRRLNKDPNFAITQNRVVNGQAFNLPPGDPRYTWLIPDNILSYNPGMQQNKR